MIKNCILLLSVLLLTMVVGHESSAQLKLGDQPTTLLKSVVLDLQGSGGKQGVWLPRIADTTDVTGIDGLNPPDGLIIFFTPLKQVMIRRNGFWAAFTTITGGYGLTGGTITTVGTLAIDTFSISTRAWRQKGIDSVAALLNNYVRVTRTLNGLALSANQTFATGTAGTDFNISSAGTVHTFNIPSASLTARGLVTTALQQFKGLKTFTDGVVVNTNATITGATGATSNLTLGVTSSTTPAGTTDKYLSVDASGNVTLNATNVIVTTGTMRIKNYSVNLEPLPQNLIGGTSRIYTITIPGANFTTPATVVVSPAYTLKETTTINWARVSGSSTIEVSVTAGAGNTQPFTSGTGATFHLTITEF